MDYYFLDAGSFLKRVQAGNFLEHATVYGNSYGTLKAEVHGKLRQGKDVLLNVDVQGAATILHTARHPGVETRAGLGFPDASLDETSSRSVCASAVPTRRPVVQKRLSVARQEIAQWRNFDYLILSASIAEDLRRMLAHRGGGEDCGRHGRRRGEL